MPRMQPMPETELDFDPLNTTLELRPSSVSYDELENTVENGA